MATTNLGRVRFNMRGDYNPAADPLYSLLDLVSDGGGSFVYINETPSNEPTSSTSHWQQIASVGGQDLLDATVEARDAAQAQAALAQGYAAQLAAGTASPAGTYANLAALNSGTPNAPNTAKIYITLDDGKWCYYNGSAWVAGGVYQAVIGFGPDATLSVTGTAADALAVGNAVNLFDPNTITTGKYVIPSTGSLGNDATLYASAFIPVIPGGTIKLPQHLNSQTRGHGFFTAAKEFISGVGSALPLTYNVPATAAYVKITGEISNIATMVLTVSGAASKSWGLLDYTNSLIENEAGNLFDPAEAVDGYIVGIATGGTAAQAGYYVSPHIPVYPNSYYRIEKGFDSGYYGHAYYDDNKVYISGIAPTPDTGVGSGGYKIIKTPGNAAFVRITGVTADVASQKILPLRIRDDDYFAAKDPYARQVIKGRTDLIDGFCYQSFSGGAMFNGKEVYASRLANTHLTDTNPANWGKIVFNIRDGAGFWSKQDFAPGAIGFDGELRDPNLTKSKLRNVMFMSCFTTYYDGETPVYDNVLFALDANLAPTSAIVQSDSSVIAWGNVLTTPNGYLLRSGYGANTSVIQRSNAAFTGDLTGITLSTVATLHSGVASPTETTIGYWDNKLVALIRQEGANALVTYTTNLEGTDGWTSPADIGIVLHSPALLPYCRDAFLLFAGSYMTSTGVTLRKPCIGYLDVVNHTVLDYAVIDEDVLQYSGYPSLVRVNSDEYGMMYYEEGGVYTPMFYKLVNPRRILHTEYIT